MISPLRALLAGLVAWFTVSPSIAAETASLHPKLEALRPFLGKTFRGEFANSTPEKPVVDVSHWERALNGNAIRSLHSINDGAYGGEMIIYWDEERQTIAYYYFTTAGFHTTGTMTVENGRFTSFEKVIGSADGITEVRGTGTINDDGTMTSSSEYLKNGEWVPGHGATYHEAPDAKVVFK
jgi:hypothetical protein